MTGVPQVAWNSMESFVGSSLRAPGVRLNLHPVSHPIYLNTRFY